MGTIRDATGSFTAGLLAIAMGALVASIVLVAFFGDKRKAVTRDPSLRHVTK